MNKEYYLLIHYLDEFANPFALAGRCIKVLHGFMHHNALNNIGITFPGWTDETIGKSIALVSSDKNSLIEYTQQKPIQIMRSHDIIELDEVKDVPSNAERTQYRRCLEAERNLLSDKKKRIRRKMKRAKSRGEEFISDTIEFKEALPDYHRIPITSTSSDSQFELFIEKIYDKNLTSLKIDHPYGRYGLSNKTKFNGTVPCLSMSYVKK